MKYNIFCEFGVIFERFENQILVWNKKNLTHFLHLGKWFVKNQVFAKEFSIQIYKVSSNFFGDIHLNC